MARLSGADLSRNPSLAGQTVMQDQGSQKYAVTYDENGYAVKATNTTHEMFKDPSYDGKYAGGNFGFTDGTTNYWSESNPGYGGASYMGSGGSSGGSSGGGSRGSSGSGNGLGPSDLSGYLNDMYNAYTQAQLAQLESAYQQNLADLQAQAEQIPQTYQTARNEAASQNDIARLAFNEYANARGLNTGTSGQAALANSAVLQSNLTDIATQESDAMAQNALEQQRLAIEYRNAAVAAQAEGNYQLAQALYNEYVRQDDASMQMAQLAQEQANWEAQFNTSNSQWQQQFDASQQQYQDNLASQQREYAYNLAMTMLSAGVMPDTNTLNQAGISTTDAMNMRLAATGSSSGGSSRSSSSSGSSRSSSSSENSSRSENTIEEVPGPGIQADEFQSQLMALSSYLSRASGSSTNSQSYRDSQFERARQLYESLYSQANATQRARLDSLASSYGIT